jgi:hypothetical protein
MRILVKIFNTLLLMHLAYALNAQGKVISGKVGNTSGEPLAYATIVLLSLPDSSYIAYTTSGNGGYYKLSYDASGEAFLQVSFLGYKKQGVKLSLDKTALTFDFELETSAELLKSATVNARLLGAKVKGDTIVYNIQKYADGTERVLKDILEKLPGIEIDNNGKVKAQGKNVNKVLIDGKEFFFDQSQMATKNLPAQMVESVDLINNFNDIGALADSKPQGITVLNIGIKNDYKGKISGTLLGAGGVQSKYAGKANLFNFSKNLNLAVIGDANNTGEMAFTLSDYVQFQGGIQRLARNQKSGNRITLDMTDAPVMSFTDDVESKVGQTGAFNMSYHHPNKKLKANSYFIMNRQKQKGERISRRWLSDSDDDIPVSIDGLSERNRFSFINSYISMDYQPTERFFISNRAMISGQNRRLNTFVNAESERSSDTLYAEEKVAMFDFKNYLLAVYKTVKGNILTFDGYYRYNKKPNTIALLSNNTFLGLPFLASENGNEAFQDNGQNAHEFSFLSEYSYKIRNIYISSQAGVNYFHQHFNSELYQLDEGINIPFLPEQDYRNDIRYKNTDLWAGLSVQRNLGIFRVSLGAEAHRYNIVLTGGDNNSLVKNTKWKVLPNIQATIYLAATHRISAIVNAGQQTRQIPDLDEAKVIKDYKTITKGTIMDELLAPSLSVSLNYFYADFYTATTLLITSSYDKQSDPIAFNYISHAGYSESHAQKSPDNNRFISLFRFRKGLGNLPVDLKIGITHAYNSYYNYINGSDNKLVINNIKGEFALMTFTKGVLNGEIGGNVTWHSNLSKLTDKTTRLLTLAPFGKLRINAGKGWLINSSVQHYKYDTNDIQRDITNLSSSITYIPPKSKFEFELNANNILNFNKSEKVLNIYTGNFFEERIFRALPGYLIFKIMYRI